MGLIGGLIGLIGSLIGLLGGLIGLIGGLIGLIGAIGESMSQSVTIIRTRDASASKNSNKMVLWVMGLPITRTTRRAKKASACRGSPQELEVRPHSGLYLLVLS